MGKLKIKYILIKNNIPIKIKGGQKIHQNTNFKFEIKNKVLSCKVCNKTFNDIENRSGTITEHIKMCSPEVEIPSKLFRSNYKKRNGEYWHFSFFNIIDKEIKETLKCPECDWETTDLVNKTGSFTKHIEKEHGDINKFITSYPSLKELLSDKLINTFEIEKEYVVCEICKQKVKILNNTHLKKHGLTVSEYKLLYPNSKILIKSISEKYREKLKVQNLNFIPTWTSSGELEIFEFLKENGLNVEKSKNRKLLEGKEIDIVINEKRLCIEYNDLYYHTEKMGKHQNYHLDKTFDCLALGYNLIHIFEDEWVLKKNIVKSKLLYLLDIKQNTKNIGARKLLIKEIDSKTKSVFLDNNHLQGNDKSKINYGAYFNDELLSVMTFNETRNMTKNNTNEYELSRFCVKQNHSLPGIASKFLKKFINEFKPESIISFSDRRWTLDPNNNLYTKLGFKLDKILKPNYTYYNSKVNKYKRFHKFNFGKKNLKIKFPDADHTKSEYEIMKSMGYEKIWDCGLFKYKLEIKKGM